MSRQGKGCSGENGVECHVLGREGVESPSTQPRREELSGSFLLSSGFVRS